MAALAGALISGCPQIYVRVFVDERPPMAALVGKLIVTCRAGTFVLQPCVEDSTPHVHFRVTPAAAPPHNVGVSGYREGAHDADLRRRG